MATKLVQVHVLQHFGVNSLNHDRTGAPKDIVLGGVRRQRVSSQCLKRAMRTGPVFAGEFAADHLLATRTVYLARLLREALLQLTDDTGKIEAVVSRVVEIGTKKRADELEVATEGEDMGEGEGDGLPAELMTRTLLYLADNEVPALARALLEVYERTPADKWPGVKFEAEVGAKMPWPRSVDMAAFGRMTTSPVFVNLEPAVQVAHAITVNGVTPADDFFTAIDDLDQVSRMLADTPVSAGLFYRYCNIHLPTLLENLDGDTAVAMRAVRALVLAFILAVPSGKQSGFAACQPAEYVLLEAGAQAVPVNYSNAFLTPVQTPGGKSLVDAAVRALDEYVGQYARMYGRHQAGLRRAATAFNPANVASAYRAVDAIDGLADLAVEWGCDNDAA